MKNSLTLSIPNRCVQRWENITKTADGGFCSSCSKTVVDFTQMGDNEIIQFFKLAPAHTCGRFRADQLKSYTERTFIRIDPGLTLVKAGFLSLLFISIGRPAAAQTAERTPGRNTVQVSSRTTRPIYGMGNDRVVSGHITGKDGEGFPGVNVVLKNSGIGTVTDVSGNFSFPAKLKTGDVLVISFIGHLTQELVISAKEGVDTDEQVKLKITMLIDDDQSWTGEVAVSGVSPETSGLQRLWSKVRGLF